MTSYRRAVELAVRRLPGMDESHQAEIVDTLHALAGEPGAKRWRELGSVAWLGVRLRARAETGDSAEVTWRQGVHLGGVLLVAASAVEAVAAAAAGGQLGAVVTVGAVALVVATCAAARGLRWASVASTGAGGLVVLVGSASLEPGTPFVTRLVVASAALVVGQAPGEDARRHPWPWLTLVLVASSAVAIEPGLGSWVVDAVVGVLPCVWMVAARADPRLAVATALAASWRLVAVDLHEVGDALVGVPTGHALDVVLVSWAVMVLVAVAAVMVARHAVRRSTLL